MPSLWQALVTAFHSNLKGATHLRRVVAPYRHEGRVALRVKGRQTVQVNLLYTTNPHPCRAPCRRAGGAPWQIEGCHPPSARRGPSKGGAKRGNFVGEGTSGTRSTLRREFDTQTIAPKGLHSSQPWATPRDKKHPPTIFALKGHHSCAALSGLCIRRANLFPRALPWALSCNSPSG